MIPHGEKAQLDWCGESLALPHWSIGIDKSEAVQCILFSVYDSVYRQVYSG
jgi:hypothetical protein